jgi:hypothetical protein|tara:strand:+ start:512 stop:613 length:102 start_codon:yes stop_codon:yes gene_type:complete
MGKKKTDKQLEKAMSSIADLLNGIYFKEEKKKK